MITFDEVFIMHIVKLIFFLLYFLLSITLILYNWLYLTHTFRAKKNIGLNPPENIRHLVRTSTYIALLNAVLLVVFLVTGNY